MHDIVVVSDLHLGRGKNPETGRYHRLEAFFYDDDFDGFCRWLCDEAEAGKRGLKLVLNGDTFDLLRIELAPGEGASRAERRFGPLMNPDLAAETVAEILAGHPGFTTGLARILAAGHHIVFTPGNHDPEMQWDPVQRVVRAALLARVRRLVDAEAATRAEPLVVFEPWFHYEPGRVWIEHGSQYDPENACRYPLRSGLGEARDAMSRAAADLPMGSFFQRYLYNFFGNLTFIVPNSRSNSRYLRWLVFHKPRTLIRVIFSHLPFFLQVVKRLARPSPRLRKLAQMHAAELAQLSEKTRLGHRLREIDRLKRVQGSAAVVTRRLLVQMVKTALLFALVMCAGAGLWFAGFYAIHEMRSGFGLKAVLFLILNFLMILVSVSIAGFMLVRASPVVPASRPGKRAARRIARIVDVPIVTFGHSHEEMIWNLARGEDRPRWYFNTGTWIAVFVYGELIPRERVQYTFLRVRGDTGELLHWSPGRREAIPVVLLEDDDSRGDPRLVTDIPAS